MHTWIYAAPGEAKADLGHHINVVMPLLAYGVVLFFTLSGFLLYRPFAASIVRGREPPSARRYLRHRALRILPAYWVILLLCAVVLGSALRRDASGELVDGHLLDPAVLLADAAFVQGYGPDTLLTGIGPAWSLAVEAVFYLALPLLALLGVALVRGRPTRSRRRWAALAPACLLLLVGLAGKAAAAFVVPAPAPYDGWGADWHSVLERSFVAHADLFAFGMALAVARVESEDGRLSLPRWWRPAVAGALLAVGAFVTLFGEGALSYSPSNTLVAAACALLLALVVLPGDRSSRSPLLRVLEWRPLVLAGVVSYSVFLWHEPLIRWLDDRGLTVAGRGGFVVNLALVGAVTAVAATLTYRLVEAPALRVKLGRGERASTGSSVPEAQAAP
jgi:peptidoglycan/LPS O-acetylase OafA/YrhL